MRVSWGRTWGLAMLFAAFGAMMLRVNDRSLGATYLILAVLHGAMGTMEMLRSGAPEDPS